MENNSKFRRRKKTRIQKLKIKRRRLISIISILSISIFLLSFFVYKIYKEFRCKDLQYAVEHELTSGNSSNRLLRVQHITLLFNDTEKAIVEVSGLGKDKPHKETTIKGTFKKGSFDSWNLEKAEES